MNRTQLNLAAVLVCLAPLLAVGEVAIPQELRHIDPLKINVNLQLHDVLEKTVVRSPMQAMMQSRELGLNAKNIVAKSILPAPLAISLGHQNDGLGSRRGEREWQADLEVPIWLPNQRHNRLKVADAARSDLSIGSASLKLQVAGQLRDAVWDIALNDSYYALSVNKYALASKLQRDVERRYQAGEMAKTDALLAEQETLRAEKDKLRAEAEVMHARNRYFLLTGLREIPASYEEVQSNLDDYRQSPIWIEAESKVSLAEIERNLAQVESHENPQVLFNIRSTKGAFDNLSNESVGVKMRIPFGSETRSAPIEAAAELGVGSALTEREKLRYAMEMMMHEAEHNLSVSRAELVLLTKQYEIAKESARLAQKAFQLGETDLVSLMRVQAQTDEAARAFTSRKIQVQWDIARYNQAVGVMP